MLCDGYVKYERAEVHRSAISKKMRKKKLNGRLAAILDFISAKFIMGYPCVRPYILFYIHGLAILHFFSYLNIKKILKLKKRSFFNFLLPKVNQVIG